MIQRALVLLVALLAIAWLGVSYGNAGRIRDAETVAGDRQATPQEIDAAIRDLRRSRPLDPSNDAEALSYEASLNIRAGRTEEGLALLERVVRIEPDTAEAWFLIAQLTQQSDPARAAEARAQLRRLDPRAARGLR